MTAWAAPAMFQIGKAGEDQEALASLLGAICPLVSRPCCHAGRHAHRGGNRRGHRNLNDDQRGDRDATST